MDPFRSLTGPSLLDMQDPEPRETKDEEPEELSDDSGEELPTQNYWMMETLRHLRNSPNIQFLHTHLYQFLERYHDYRECEKEFGPKMTTDRQYYSDDRMNMMRGEVEVLEVMAEHYPLQDFSSQCEDDIQKLFLLGMGDNPELLYQEAWGVVRTVSDVTLLETSLHQSGVIYSIRVPNTRDMASRIFHNYDSWYQGGFQFGISHGDILVRWDNCLVWKSGDRYMIVTRSEIPLVEITEESLDMAKRGLRHAILEIMYPTQKVLPSD